MEILENITIEQFLLISFTTWFFISLNDVIVCIMNYFNERAWLVRDYEKVITKYINTHDAENIKDLELITKAKSKVKKRIKNKEKLKKLFNKGKK